MKLKVLATFGVAAMISLAWGTTSRAADTFPSQDACHVTNNASPAGNCGSFTLLDRETFNAVQVPVGGFSNCAGDGNFKCAGLKTKYPSYYNTLGAYPDGWPDTAGSGADGNSGPVPGTYQPSKAASVILVGTDGQMRVHMSYASGHNSVAAMVPLPCMNLRYGKFTERVKISNTSDRFKMAHLRYSPNEVDYPEAGSNFASDPVSEFTHGFKESGADVGPNADWTSWHTYSTEIVPNQIRFYLDGKLVSTVNADFPDSTDWILQNESALGISSVSGATSVNVDTSWLTCYKYSG
jgi:hypothetical protein